MKAEEKESLQGTEKEFLDIFRTLCYSRSSWQVWADLMSAIACSLSNVADQTQASQIPSYCLSPTNNGSLHFRQYAAGFGSGAFGHLGWQGVCQHILHIGILLFEENTIFI